MTRRDGHLVHGTVVALGLRAGGSRRGSAGTQRVIYHAVAFPACERVLVGRRRHDVGDGSGVGAALRWHEVAVLDPFVVVDVAQHGGFGCAAGAKRGTALL